MLQTRNLLLMFVLTTLFGCADGGPTIVDAQTNAAEPKTQLAAPANVSEGLTDLWTRKKGVDWPDFLGPNRDSKSPETGIISPWPATGLKIVWQRELQTGYGIGTISKGRMYHFERQGKQRRCCASKRRPVTNCGDFSIRRTTKICWDTTMARVVHQ